MAVPGDDLVSEVKARTDILDVVSDYVKLRPAGKSHVGLCPFHAEKTPSFSVNPDKGFWHCYGCAEGGDVLKFVQKIENLSFRETLERLAKRAGIAIPERREQNEASSERERMRALHELACRFYEKSLTESPEAKAYLHDRGIAPEMVQRFRIGYAPDSWDALRGTLRRERASDDDMVKAGLLKRKDGDKTGGYDAFRDRLIFPIADAEGRIIAFGGRIMAPKEGQPKYLNSPETPIFQKSRVLYGLHRALTTIKERREVLVMEGYMDVVAAHEFGFPYAVAPMGTSLTEAHLQILKRMCDRALLVFDADSAGMKAALRSLSLFETSEIEPKVVVLPEGEDPDSLLRKRGMAPFSEAIHASEPLVDYRMNAILQKHDFRTDNGYQKAMSEIVPLLRQTISADTWVRRLAEIRSAGATQRVAFHEEEIRLPLRGGPWHRASSQKETVTPTDSSDEAPVSTALRNLYNMEELVLRASMEDQKIATELLTLLPPNRFLRPETTELATLISAQCAEASWNPSEWTVDSEGVMSMLGRLANDPTPIPNLDDMKRVVNRIHDYWNSKEVRSLTEDRTPTTEELQRINQLYLQK